MSRTSLVTAVEVRTSKASTIHSYQMPVRVERNEDNLTALVFHGGAGIYPIVTVVLTGADRIALIELLGGTVDVDVHH